MTHHQRVEIARANVGCYQLRVRIGGEDYTATHQGYAGNPPDSPIHGLTRQEYLTESMLMQLQVKTKQPVELLGVIWQNPERIAA